MIYSRKEGHAFVEALHMGFSCRHFFIRSCSIYCLSCACHGSMQKWVQLLMLEIRNKIL